MPVLWWAYLRQLQHEAQRHADQSGDKAGHRDNLPSIQMPELCKELLRGDPFKCPEARITERAASWISAFLRLNIPISTVQRITGVHWDTIKRSKLEGFNNRIKVAKRIAYGYRDEDYFEPVRFFV